MELDVDIVNSDWWFMDAMAGPSVSMLPNGDHQISYLGGVESPNRAFNQKVVGWTPTGPTFHPV